MDKKQNDDLKQKCQEILEGVPSCATDDEKMRYLIHELGLILSKNVEFFYGQNKEYQQQIYQNYQTIENMEVICRNAVFLYTQMATELGLTCKPIEVTKDEEVPFNHWALEYFGDNDKRYLINPIPDFYRIQLDFSTKHFCCTEEYKNYEGASFDSMSEEYIRKLDISLGYINENDKYAYTDEMLEELRRELSSKLGSHLVQSSDTYQDYYLTMLELIRDDNLSIDEKLERIKKMDSSFEQHKEIIELNLKQKVIDKNMRKIIYNLSYKSLLGENSILEKERDGARYLATVDVTKIKNLKTEMLTYKFNYMLECLPQLTRNLNGYIENKNFMDELQKYMFRGGEKDKIHRHTVIREVEGTKEYCMIFSLQIDENKLYSFYNPKTKEVVRKIEPLNYMQEHHFKPLAHSSLNQEITRRIQKSNLVSLNVSMQNTSKSNEDNNVK